MSMINSALSLLGNPFGLGASVANGDIPETRHRGASRTLRSMSSWFARAGDAVADAPTQELSTMRARSRDAYRNLPLAGAVVSRSKNSIVGTGVMAHPDIAYKTLGLTREQAKIINGELREYFTGWADSMVECDQEAAEDFYGLQGLALVSSMCSGDVLCLTPYELRQGGSYALKTQLIEADRVCNPNSQTNSARLVDGVVLDHGGMALGYWVARTHPGSVLPDAAMNKWDYYPAFDQDTGRRRAFLVSNDKDRPGQVRAAPFLAPVLEPLQKLEKFSRAELTAAVIDSLVTFFIEKENERVDGLGSLVGPTGEELVDGEPTHIELGEGAFIDLAQGEKINKPAPTRPNSQFRPYYDAIVNQIGARLGVPGSEIMLLYQESYTAARAAMLQAWRFFTARRWRLVQQFCQPMYELLLDEGVAAGDLALPGYSDPKLRRAWSRCLWNGPARGAMDELKEAQAAEKRIQIGVSNEAIEASQMSGEDRDSIHAQRAVEVAERKADGTYAEQFPKATEQQKEKETGND